MKRAGHLEKFAGGMLGVVCLILAARLVWQMSGSRVGAARAALQADRASGRRVPLPQKISRQTAPDVARYDPVVKEDLLKTLQARPLPKLSRNPFEFEAPPASVQKAQGAAPPTVAAAPPPPPPVPLKALGFTEKPGGVREGLVTDDEQIYVVHEGDKFANRYHVMKITPATIEIQDETSHQTVELPFSQ